MKRPDGHAGLGHTPAVHRGTAAAKRLRPRQSLGGAAGDLRRGQGAHATQTAEGDQLLRIAPGQAGQVPPDVSDRS